MRLAIQAGGCNHVATYTGKIVSPCCDFSQDNGVTGGVTGDLACVGTHCFDSLRL